MQSNRNQAQTLALLTLLAIAPAALASGGGSPTQPDSNEPPESLPNPEQINRGNSPFKLEFGEAFRAVGSSGVDLVHADYDSDKYPDIEDCENTSTAALKFDYEFVNVTTGGREYQARSPWFRSYSKSRDGLFTGSYTVCEWASAKIKADLLPRHQRLANARRFLVLDRMSNAANAIDARMVVQTDALRDILASARNAYEIYMTLTLKACVDDRGNTVTTLTPDGRGETKLSDFIEALRKRSTRVFTKCTLALTHVKTPGDLFKDGGQIKVAEYANHGRYLFNMLDTQADKIFTSEVDSYNEGNKLKNTYTRVNEAANSAKERAALEASRAFINFIVSDYGDLLYDLNDRNAPKEEKEQTVKAFFETNSPQLKQWLTELDENYADVAIMKKVTLLINFKDMYKSIALIEHDVLQSRSINLDRVIRDLGGN